MADFGNDTCTLAKSIVGDKYRTVLLVELIFAVLAVPPNLFLLTTVWRVTVFPANLRLLLAHFSFVILWYAVGDIVKGAYLLIGQPCAFNFSIRDCRLFDLSTTHIALPNMFYSLTALCVERLYASIRYKIYDKTDDHRPWLAGVLIFGAWLTAFAINGSDVLWLPNNILVPVCEIQLMPQYARTNPYVSFVYLIEECLAAVITVFIFFYNRYIARNMIINRARYDLSARFLVVQNVQVNELVIPIMLLHLLCYAPAYGFMLCINGVFGPPVPSESRAWLSRLTYVWRLVHAVAHPLLAFYFNFHLKNQLRKNFIAKYFVKRSRKIRNGIIRYENHNVNGDNNNNNMDYSRYMNGNNHHRERENIGAVNLVIHFNHLEKLWAADKLPINGNCHI